MKLIARFATLAFTIGCSSTPSASQLAVADFGPGLDQSSAEQRASAWLSENIDNPEMAEIKFSEVRDGYIRNKFAQGNNFVYGSRLDASVNAISEGAGFTGHRPYVFMYYGDHLMGVWGHYRSYHLTGPYDGFRRLEWFGRPDTQ